MSDRPIVEPLPGERWSEALIFTAGERFEEADDVYQFYVGCGETQEDAVWLTVQEMQLPRCPERDAVVDAYWKNATESSE